MKQIATIVTIEIAVLAIIVIIVMSVFLGSRDEFLVKRHFNLALDYYYGGHQEEALSKLRFCRETKPEYAPPYQVEAAIFLSRGDYETAESLYAASIENAGEDALPLSDLGLNIAGAMRAAARGGDSGELKQFADAIEAMRNEIRHPSDALVSAAAVKVTAGDNAGARMSLSSLNSKEGTIAVEAVPVWRNSTAILEFDNDRKDEAMRLLREAAELDPDWRTPVINLSAMSVATVTAESTVKEVLVKLFDELCRTDTAGFLEEQAYNYHNTLGVVGYFRIDRGRVFQSLDQLDKAITLMPQRAEAKINKAAIMMLEYAAGPSEFNLTQNTMQESERLVSEAIRFSDNSTTKYYACIVQGLLGIVQNDTAKAVDGFSLAVKEIPEDYLAHRGLGMAYLVQERYDKARQHLEKSNEFKAGQKDVQEALKTLQAVPRIENTSVRYTSEASPVVGIRASVYSCPTTVEDSRIEITFGDIPAVFKARPSFITCAPLEELQDGKYSINVSLTDAAGNIARESFDLSVDRTPPKVEAVKPKVNGEVKAPMPEMRVRLFDELSEVDDATVILKYMTGPGMDVMVSQDVVKFGRYMYDMPEKGIDKDQLIGGDMIEFTPKNKLSPGNYRIQLEAKDILGNKTLERYDFVITE